MCLWRPENVARFLKALFDGGRMTKGILEGSKRQAWMTRCLKDVVRLEGCEEDASNLLISLA